MPELPEVETIVRKLARYLKGKKIHKITVFRDKSFQDDPLTVEGATIVDVVRRAKLIKFVLDSQLNLLSHLKMTGQFIYTDPDSRVGGGHPTADWVQSLPSSHTRVMFELSDSSKLFFNDQRVFGWIKTVDTAQEELEFSRYAPDVISPLVTPTYFYEKLQRTSRPIKVVIMDNTIVSGVGNIYACDALNLAKINPTRQAKSLGEDESTRLLSAAQTVILKGIETGGATIDNYRDVEGFSGQYQDVVRVYGREGLPCQNCGGEIQKVKIAGRGTYWCPKCQL
jgi:formamidopyrimidine-DNA glycosylase